MKVTAALPVVVHLVTTDQKEFHTYTRFSSANWTQTMGESDEPVYDLEDCEELEAAYQAFMKSNGL